MLSFFQEVTLPKLSQTSFYEKFDQTSKLSENIKYEIIHSKEFIVTPDTLAEILAMIRLNGDAVAKKAVEAFKAGDIVVIFNKSTSRIPASLPYIIMAYKGKPTAFIFADKIVNNITAVNEYTNFMAALEAAYLALILFKTPDTFLMNSQLMLTLCKVYSLIATAPLEQRLYMKGDNLNKAMLYVIAYFYRMIKGDNINESTVPYKQLMKDKIDPKVVSQIIQEVVSLEDRSFMAVIKLIMKINPIRYKNLDALYMSYFTSTCGVAVIFALENIAYLFMMITSSAYKTSITSYGINKTVSLYTKSAIAMLSSAISS